MYPYVCQWESRELVGQFIAGTLPVRQDPLWERSGATTRDEYEFWSRRACGLACLKMLLRRRGVPCAGTVELARTAHDRRCFVIHAGGVRGLLYRPFAAWVADQYDLDVEVVENDTVAAVMSRVTTDTPFLASVHPSIRHASPGHIPPARGGHLVLVHSSSMETLTFHNPSGDRPQTQENVTLDCKLFERYYAGRGMQIQSPQARGGADRLRG
jgi:hypothetical protein